MKMTPEDTHLEKATSNGEHGHGSIEGFDPPGLIDDERLTEASNTQDAAIEPVMVPGMLPSPEVKDAQVVIEQLDQMIEQVKKNIPEYSPPAFSLTMLLELIETNMWRLSPESTRLVVQRLRSTIREGLFDLDTWQGIWYALNYFLEYQTRIIKNRRSGDYEVDEWGYDADFVKIITPFMNFMYKSYWRVEVTGLENIPLDGRALLVCNHSGQIPWDGAMLAAAVYNHHPNQRLLRNLYSEVFPAIPFVSLLLVKLGQVLANEENGIRLLEQDQLVGVFPEGHKGVSKIYKDRYRLRRFGRGGFADIALQARAPIIPVSIVGAEETYITLYQSQLLARIVGLPFFPITLTWPWLGILGFIPLPTKWFIDIGEPINVVDFDAGAAINQVIAGQISDLTRNMIQNMVFERLTHRKSIFWG